MNQQQNETNMKPVSKMWQILFCLSAFIIVAFGQPARSLTLGAFAACFGYALFWRVLLCYENPRKRFLLATFWFAAVQIVQFSWMTAHPFWYIIGPYVVLSFLFGSQFGLLGLFIKPANLIKFRTLFAISGFWVMMEWVRLFILSGYSWNPAGLALTGSIYPLQMASLFGVYGLSFWVIFVNLLFLKFWINFSSNKNSTRDCALFAIGALTPYIFGVAHLAVHQAKSSDNKDFFNGLLVQPSFAVDSLDHIQGRKALVYFVLEQMRQILEITKKQQSEKIDLIVLPEYVVPFGTYTTVYPLESVREIFEEVFGEKSLDKLPKLDDHLVQQFKQDESDTVVTFVNNAFWLQAMSNIFNAPVVAGLEDVDDGSMNERNYYSAALYFLPACTDCSIPERYEKRVLVPLGEYIPFSFCQQLAIRYGVTGSFTKGEKAKVFPHPKANFGVSICYEETFGHVMRENRLEGAELLVNLTNDGWFPNSTLTKQHFDHARLRSVESGIPLIRACNTGITGGFDSLGQVVAVLENEDLSHEMLSDSLLIKMPTYTYRTIYSQFGDNLILAFSFLTLLGFYRRSN